jgi:enoyl-CoA hydratase
MSDAGVIVQDHGPITVLLLNRPRRLNALSNALLAELVAALEASQADPSKRVAVLTGDERAFAAGADIGDLGAPGGPRLEEFDRLWKLELPLIGAVRGLALGGGLELAMSCDLLVVADDARLGQPEVNLGLIPGAGGTQRLTHAVGKATAMEMVLLGRELSGSEAFARGLASACVPAERVLGKALELAGAIAVRAPRAVRAAKRAVLNAFELPLRPALLAERAAFRELLQTADGREGIAAFLEKRQPVWSDL